MAEMREMANISILGALFVFVLLAFAVPANALDAQAKVGAGANADGKLNMEYEEDRIMAGLDSQDSVNADITSDTAINSQITLLGEDTRNYRLPNESSYTLVSTGNGWVTGNSTGNFAKIVLVERVFWNASDEDDEMRAGRGLIKISGDNAYRLRSHGYGENSATFDIIDDDGNAQGTLILIKRTSFSAFSVWEGSVELDSGQSYDLEVATMSRRNISPDDIATGAENESQKLGAWSKLRAFLRLN